MSDEIKINKTFVDRVSIPDPKPNGQATSTFYRDNDLKGFGLRVYSGGTKAFIVERRVNGKVRRVTLGKYPTTTAERARQKALALLSDMAKGIDPTFERSPENTRNITLEMVFEDYLETHPNLRPATVADYRRVLKEGIPDWVPKKVVDISKDMVVRKHRKLSSKSHARADNTMRVLRALINHAIARYDDENGNPILQINPVSVLSRTRAWNPRKRKERYIKPHQLPEWYKAIMTLSFEVSRDYFIFLLFTGLRKTEATTLRWEDVDMVDRTFTIQETKNRQPHTLPMSDFLYELFEKRFESKRNEWVFPSDRNEGYHLVEPKSGLRRVVARSGIEFSFHDLRRTFITIAESLDLSHYSLKRLLNHKNNSDVTEGYIILDIDRLREPMQRISERILLACHGKFGIVHTIEKQGG